MKKHPPYKPEVITAARKQIEYWQQQLPLKGETT
jgi:hypothetical protein